MCQKKLTLKRVEDCHFIQLCIYKIMNKHTKWDHILPLRLHESNTLHIGVQSRMSILFYYDAIQFLSAHHKHIHIGRKAAGYLNEMKIHCVNMVFPFICQSDNPTHKYEEVTLSHLVLNEPGTSSFLCNCSNIIC